MIHKRYVYLLKTDDNRYKIGVSVNVERRIKQLQTGCSDRIMVVDTFLSKFPFKLESALHRKYESSKINGEWYLLTNESVSEFQNICSQMEHNYNCMSEYGNPFI